MKLRIYITGGATISADITKEDKETLVNWFDGKGKNVITLNDNNSEKLLNRKNISVIVFEN